LPKPIARVVSILSVTFATVVSLDMSRVDDRHGCLQIELLNETLLRALPARTKLEVWRRDYNAA